jgi:hypothetical protein
VVRREPVVTREDAVLLLVLMEGVELGPSGFVESSAGLS